MPRRFKKLMLIPRLGMADELGYELDVLDWLEKACYSDLELFGVPPELWQYYVGYAKRQWERILKFGGDTLTKEKISIKNEYTLRGLDPDILDLLDDDCLAAAEYKWTGVKPDLPIRRSAGAYDMVVIPLWIQSAYYSARVKDGYVCTPHSRIQILLAEDSKPADAYSLVPAALVQRSLTETSHPADSYSHIIDSLVVEDLPENAKTADAYSLTEASRIQRILTETPHPADTYSYSKASLVVRNLAEIVHATDAYNIVIIYRVERRIRERVYAQEVSLSIAPWEENPVYKLWVYYISEKPLTWDAFSRIYRYVSPGKTTLDEPVKTADAYNMIMKPLLTKNLFESVSAIDVYIADVFSEWWYAKKYDGYVEAEIIYNFVVTKYDGYVESSVVA